MTIEAAEKQLIATLRELRKRFRVSSPFGSRIHPITGKPQFHNGIDISTPTGTEIVIPFPLQCVVWWDAQYGGGLSAICTGKEYRYGFAHLDRVIYANGSLILHTGNTGVSTGPHLHLTVRPSNRNEYIDPDKILMPT